MGRVAIRERRNISSANRKRDEPIISPTLHDREDEVEVDRAVKGQDRAVNRFMLGREQALQDLERLRAHPCSGARDPELDGDCISGQRSQHAQPEDGGDRDDREIWNLPMHMKRAPDSLVDHDPLVDSHEGEERGDEPQGAPLCPPSFPFG
ncbi:MAG: hypothetical protein AABM43_01080 [Actinomycetota bacterium]